MESAKQKTFWSWINIFVLVLFVGLAAFYANYKAKERYDKRVQAQIQIQEIKAKKRKLAIMIATQEVLRVQRQKAQRQINLAQLEHQRQEEARQARLQRGQEEIQVVEMAMRLDEHTSRDMRQFGNGCVDGQCDEVEELLRSEGRGVALAREKNLTTDPEPQGRDAGRGGKGTAFFKKGKRIKPPVPTAPRRVRPSGIAKVTGNCREWKYTRQWKRRAALLEPYYIEAMNKYTSPLSLEELMTVGMQESYFCSDRYSTAGAYGVMQLMPKTAIYLKVNRMNIRQNIRGGVKYLAENFEFFKTEESVRAFCKSHGCYQVGLERLLQAVRKDRETGGYQERFKMALFAYNAGRGNVARRSTLPRETRNYIAGITGEYREKIQEWMQERRAHVASVKG